MGKYEDAIIYLNKSLEIKPNNVSALTNCGDIYRMLNRYEESLADLNKALEIDPNCVEALNNLTYRVMDRYEESLTDLSRSLELEPNNVDVLNNRGNIYRMLGKYEESLVDLNKALEIEPNSVDAWNIQSFSDLSKSSEINQNNRSTCQMVESIADSCKSFDNIIESNNQMSSGDNSDDSDLNNVMALNKHGLTYQQVDDYEKTLESESNNSGVWNNLEASSNNGLAYQKMDDEMLGTSKKSLEIGPNERLDIGGSSYKSNEKLNTDLMIDYLMDRSEVLPKEPLEKSLLDLNKTLEINPDNATALYYRGLTYHYMSRYKESLVNLNKSLGIKSRIKNPEELNEGQVEIKDAFLEADKIINKSSINLQHQDAKYVSQSLDQVIGNYKLS
ncbi:17573_t:CDS:2 [Cetraspora pellucida]|uniref:17573_t:CDS:1 n=1 Tax=Cetraspora pellucida TaxID=1433469 RepID=A0A9N9AKX5_9GLOM|nr:17573_t:CDS:2 [Cetraspora pellucida]